MTNPLLTEWNTPFGTPPFGTFEITDYKPAITECIRTAAEEIDRIALHPEPPDFENTIAALDRATEKLGDISAILFNLNSCDTCKELQEVAREVSPLLTRFSNDITMNETLFARVKAVCDSANQDQLNSEQKMLLEKYYRNFLLGGAGLDTGEKLRFREISEELSRLTMKFEENVLAETNAFELHLTDSADLAGIPGSIIEAASMEAGSRNKEGCIFTLHFPAYIPFMKYSDKRELREKMYRAYTSRSFHNDKYDNRNIAARIANLRLDLAKLLGFETFTHMTLGDRMAKTPEKVESFLDELFEAALPAARRDLAEVENYARENAHTGVIERWDWPYYAEKLQKAKYDIDDEILRPYFSLENTEKAVFGLASKLFGLIFKNNDTIPVYNHEVKTWEVRDFDNTFLAILYLDYFPRKGKNGGAWMTNFRDQRISNGKDIRPLVSIVTNFTRQTETIPSLLNFNEVKTFMHEFGHALHGMLSKCTYESLSGTGVARDFVELPSQFMENFACEEKWLRSWAVHYKTGKPLPAYIIKRIIESSRYNEGYACNRQISFAYLDMAWHSLTEPVTDDIGEFENKAMAKTELFPPVKGSNMSVSFSHIFAGGYAAGYYGYKWAEVLDADAFKHFKETGIFNTETAASFRRNILEKGGTEKPMDLYIKFRGKKPSINAFLERNGLK